MQCRVALYLLVIVTSVQVGQLMSTANTSQVKQGPEAINSTTNIADLFRRRRSTVPLRRQARYMYNPLPILDLATQNRIVDEHNRYRYMEPAADMQPMQWDENLRASAQAYAERCTYAHSHIPGLGENIWAATYSDYSGALKMWHDEVCYQGCGITYRDGCGHYTQMIWANTTKIGCGYVACSNMWTPAGENYKYMLICHYSPPGNMMWRLSNGALVALPAYTRVASDSRDPKNECQKGPECANGLCF